MKFESLAINCVQIDSMKTFYELLGCSFEPLQIRGGQGGFLHQSGNFKLKLLAASQKTDSFFPVVQFSFQVSDLKAVYEKLLQHCPAQVFMEPFSSTSGFITLIAVDPQGNSVEVFSSEA